MNPGRIISGGQTGADQGGLAAGRKLGIPTGGYAPKGWRTEVGSAGVLLGGFGLQEAARGDYPFRTRLNVLWGDATVIFGNAHERGSALTKHLCDFNKRPVLVVPMECKHMPPCQPLRDDDVDEAAAAVYRFLKLHAPSVLNVAGNCESKAPGIFAFTRDVLVLAIAPAFVSHTGDQPSK